VIAVALQTAGGGGGGGGGVDEDPPPPHPVSAMSMAVAAKGARRQREREWMFIRGLVPAREPLTTYVSGFEREWIRVTDYRAQPAENDVGFRTRHARFAWLQGTCLVLIAFDFPCSATGRPTGAG
jgi:hypothetical protein